MTQINTAEYYRMREAQELLLAQIAVNPAIGMIHMEMARHYADLLLAVDPSSGLADGHRDMRQPAPRPGIHR